MVMVMVMVIPPPISVMMVVMVVMATNYHDLCHLLIRFRRCRPLFINCL
jgi:hypothetical protein